jgi:hypothetical protein
VSGRTTKWRQYETPFREIDDAVSELHRTGNVLNLTAQVLIEFRNAATRPATVNGLGLSVLAAEAHAA